MRGQWEPEEEGPSDRKRRQWEIETSKEGGNALASGLDDDRSEISRSILPHF